MGDLQLKPVTKRCEGLSEMEGFPIIRYVGANEIPFKRPVGGNRISCAKTQSTGGFTSQTDIPSFPNTFRYVTNAKRDSVTKGTT